MSQSLFYWNPFCNQTVKFEEVSADESQSLFYWNPFCNIRSEGYKEGAVEVAILILLESFLQSETYTTQNSCIMSRNPYFIGILSAINMDDELVATSNKSQSLFYWNPFCNIKKYRHIYQTIKVAILILLESFLQ